MDESKDKRKRGFQFSLRFLVVVVLVIGLGATGYHYWRYYTYWCRDKPTRLKIRFKDGTTREALVGRMTVYHFGRTVEFDDLVGFVSRRNSRMKEQADYPPQSHESTTDDSKVMYAADLLGQSGHPRALAPLVGLLKDPYYLVRGWAASSLTELGDPKAGPALIEELKSGRGANSQLISAIIALGDPGVVPDLVAMLETADGIKTQRLLKAIEKLGSPKVVPDLVTKLDIANEIQRRLIVDAIVRFSDTERVPLLIDTMATGSVEGIEARMQAIERITGLSLERVRSGWGRLLRQNKLKVFSLAVHQWWNENKSNVKRSGKGSN